MMKPLDQPLIQNIDLDAEEEAYLRNANIEVSAPVRESNETNKLRSSESMLFKLQKQNAMLEYIKYVIGIEKLEETEMMPIINEQRERRLYTALLSQFSYICFFTPYCV